MFYNSKYGFVSSQNYQSDDKVYFDNENNNLMRHRNTVTEFEHKFGSLIGIGSCIAFATARMGFYAILKSLELQPKDEVILTGFTCSVMVNAVLKLNAKPVYVDINKDTFGTCPKDLKKKNNI